MASDKKNRTGKSGKTGDEKLGTTEFGGTSTYESSSSRSSLGKKIAVASAAVAAVGAAAVGVAAVKRRKAASGSDFTATSSDLDAKKDEAGVSTPDKDLVGV